MRAGTALQPVPTLHPEDPAVYGVGVTPMRGDPNARYGVGVTSMRGCDPNAGGWKTPLSMA